MIWLLPRSDPGATDTYLRPGRCGVSAPTARLPHGPLPRLFMLWLYAECARDAQGDLERQYALADYLLALEFEQRPSRSSPRRPSGSSRAAFTPTRR